MTVQSNKTLGVLGAILVLTGVASTVISIVEQVSGITTSLVGLGLTAVIGLLSFVGYILFLVAMYGFSKDYTERRIFTDIIFGILIAIVSGVIVGVAWVGFVIISLFGQLSSAGSLSSGSQALITPYTAIIIPVMSAIALVVLLFIYRAYNLLAKKSGVQLFSSAAKIFVLSAVLNVILGVTFAVLAYNNVIQYTAIVLALSPGAFIQYIAWALSAKGFSAIQPTATTQPYPTANQTLYCPNCGTQTQPGSIYCVKCGKKL
jgi:uncharacterized membrane protein